MSLIISIYDCRPWSVRGGVPLDLTCIFDKRPVSRELTDVTGLWLEIADIRRYFSAFIYFALDEINALS